MRFPVIGDIVTTEEALELCRHFRLHYLIKRIESNPDTYKECKFDGRSDPDFTRPICIVCNVKKHSISQ